MKSQRLAPEKFKHPEVTAKGEERALVALTRLRTLWINTGTLCNLTCHGCYIESSPTNDRLAYIRLNEVLPYLEEIERDGLPVEEIGFTGGEPFMNPEFPAILEACLARGFSVLVLTNAMKPLTNNRPALLALRDRYRKQMTFRVSIDHYERSRHEELRGERSWEPMLEGVKWLVEHNFRVAVAGRSLWGEPEDRVRAGYRALFAALEIPVSVENTEALVLFPEMDEAQDVPEITVSCWDILGVKPEAMMCATSRMVIRRKEDDGPVVTPCTLLPYDKRFEMGRSLAASSASVRLNHPHCAKFCVLGGGSCSAG